MGVPASYRKQPSCDTCGRCYRRPDYECGHGYYCTNDGRPRPRSGWRNYGKGSPDTWNDDPQWEVWQRLAWDRWARTHEVWASHICDEWTPATTT